MHIIIVGGGIAGLSSAIALRQSNANHAITILESTQQNREVGATISLQPNASKIVEQQWGLGPALEARGAMIDRGFAIYGVDGKLQMRLPLSTMEKYGAERVMHHRQDLHECLKEKAVGDGDGFGGKAAVLRTGCKVVECDAIQGTVTLESGEVLKGDLIVGADGIKSAVRKAVLGGGPCEADSVAQRTGYSAYRFMLRVDELVKEKDFSNVIDPRSPQTTMVVGHDRRLIMGPARDASVFGVVALIPDAILKESSDDASWVTRGSSEKMLEAFDVFPEWTKVMLRQAKEAGLWQLRDLDPLPTWYRGRAIVIGDAAHAMLPTQGQGASQAVEDAEALGAYFADLNGDAAPSLEEVERRNKMVFDSRYERASTIQAYSRQAVKPVQTTAKVAMNPGEFMDYNCSYKGAVDWVRRHKPSSTAEVLRRFVAIAQ